MTLTLVIGVGIISFLFLILFFKLGENEDTPHYLLQILLLGVLMGCFLLIAKGVMDNCDNQIDTISSNNTFSFNATTNTTSLVYSVESYSYKNVCLPSSNQTGNIFYNIIIWFVRIFAVYLFVFSIYQAGVYMGIWKKKRKSDDE